MPEVRQTQRSIESEEWRLKNGAVMFFNNRGNRDLVRELYKTGQNRRTLHFPSGFCMLRVLEDRSDMPEFTHASHVGGRCEFEIEGQLFEVHRDPSLEMK